MAALAVDCRFRRHGIEVHRGDGTDCIDERNRICATITRRPRRVADIGDVGCQFHDHRLVVVFLAPACDHFDIFRHLPYGRAHAAFAHPVRAAEVQLNPIRLGFRHARQDAFPGRFFAGHHDRNNHGAVGIVGFDARNLFEVYLQRTVGDQLNIVEPQQPPIRAIDGAVARAVYIDHGWAFFAKSLPYDPTPARLKGAADVVFLVRGRRRGQPERVGAGDAQEVCCQVCHNVPPHAPVRAA